MYGSHFQREEPKMKTGHMRLVTRRRIALAEDTTWSDTVQTILQIITGFDALLGIYSTFASKKK